ncbi:MAG TPA: polymer-forming cytoskeletal protein [Patescibacteria group bacterium]|nr:polymer-forming cytoskeletal protein [Patescibacteria group bacterium]
MALFTKETEVTHGAQPTASKTIIGSTVKVEGTIQSDDNIIIEGQLVGKVVTSKNITVGKDAKIQADMQAQSMDIAGEVRGNLKAVSDIQLHASAHVYGDLVAKNIGIESGAVLQGQCTTGENKEANAVPTVKQQS